MKRAQGPSFNVRFTRRGAAARGLVKPARSNDDAPVRKASDTADIYVGIAEEIFEPAPKMEIHLHQEHTAPAQQKTAPRLAPPTGLKEKALWQAASRGDCAAIRILVIGGADLDARDAQGRTAINIATQKREMDALKTLLAGKEMRRMARYDALPAGAFFDKFKQP